MGQFKNKQLYKNKTKLNKLSKNQTNTPKYQNLKKSIRTLSNYSLCLDRFD